MVIPINKQGGRATYYYLDAPARRGKGVLGRECPLGR